MALSSAIMSKNVTTKEGTKKERVTLLGFIWSMNNEANGSQEQVSVSNERHLWGANKTLHKQSTQPALPCDPLGSK